MFASWRTCSNGRSASGEVEHHTDSLVAFCRAREGPSRSGTVHLRSRSGLRREARAASGTGGTSPSLRSLPAPQHSSLRSQATASPRESGDGPRREGRRWQGSGVRKAGRAPRLDTGPGSPSRYYLSVRIAGGRDFGQTPRPERIAYGFGASAGGSRRLPAPSCLPSSAWTLHEDGPSAQPTQTCHSEG